MVRLAIASELRWDSRSQTWFWANGRKTVVSCRYALARRTSACDRTSYDRVVKSFVDASGPLEAEETFSGSGCITCQWEFSTAGKGRAP